MKNVFLYKNTKPIAFTYATAKYLWNTLAIHF